MIINPVGDTTKDGVFASEMKLTFTTVEKKRKGNVDYSNRDGKGKRRKGDEQ